MIKQLALSIVLSAALAAPALADIKIGNLVISQPWARATPPGARVAGAYLTITNHGSDADRLVSVASSGSQKAELHSMSMSGGVMSMRPLSDGIAIAPGDTVTLKPDGVHIMLIKPKMPLRQGTTVPLELTFAKAGVIHVDVDVEPIGAKGPGAKGMGPGETMPGMKMDQPAQ